MLTSSGLKIGLGLPQGFVGEEVDLGLVRRYAQRAEALGFDDLWVVDQVLGRIPILEAVTLLAYVAGVTERIRLGTSVLVTNLRNPVLLAKQLSSLDHISGGRLTVGIGLGGDTAEYRSFGLSPERRVTRFLEGVKVMKALWNEAEARRDSPFWPLDGISMEPKPLQQPSIPLWFGARAPEALRRAVDLGNGWMGAGSSSIDDYLGQIATIRSLLAERGLTSDAFPLSKRLYLAIDTDRERARARMREWIGAFYGDPAYGDRWAIVGSVEDVAATLKQLQAAGANHVLLNTVFDYEEQLDLISRDLLPML